MCLFVVQLLFCFSLSFQWWRCPGGGVPCRLGGVEGRGGFLILLSYFDGPPPALVNIHSLGSNPFIQSPLILFLFGVNAASARFIKFLNKTALF